MSNKGDQYKPRIIEQDRKFYLKESQDRDAAAGKHPKQGFGEQRRPADFDIGRAHEKWKKSTLKGILCTGCRTSSIWPGVACSDACYTVLKATKPLTVASYWPSNWVRE